MLLNGEWNTDPKLFTEFGQMKTMGPESFEKAEKEFNKKFKDKSGHKWEERSEPAKKGKYTFLERDYEDDDDEDGGDGVKKEEDDEDAPKIDSKLPRQTQRLMELIFNQNHFNAVLESIGYNANKLPLGKLSKATLKQGFDHLNELASLIKHPALAQNKYGVDQEEVRLAFPVVDSRMSSLHIVLYSHRMMYLDFRTSLVPLTSLVAVQLPCRYSVYASCQPS